MKTTRYKGDSDLKTAAPSVTAVAAAAAAVAATATPTAPTAPVRVSVCLFVCVSV